MDSYIGEIRVLPYTYAPYEWAYCNGQKININQNQALYAVIGSVFGGDNQTYFNLPNLMQATGQPGDAPMGSGAGPNLTPRSLGPNAVGAPKVQLVPNQMPSHNHPFKSEGPAAATDLIAGPAGAYICRGYVGLTPPIGFFTYNPPPTDSSKLTSFREPALTIAGSSSSHNNMQPYLAMNFCISLAGVYPVRQ
jgi:microcystin-dependent protein